MTVKAKSKPTQLAAAATLPPTTEIVESSGKLFVSEIFGPTLQGEGPSLGRRCVFLRLGGCNQSCVWCDTAYTWDFMGKNGIKYEAKDQIKQMSLEDVKAGIVGLPGVTEDTLVVISGGEPLLQQAALADLLRDHQPSVSFPIEVETAGTIKPDVLFAYHVNRFNVSPKLAHSGNPKDSRFKPEVLEQFTGTGWPACFKFVVRDKSDFDEIAEIIAEVGTPGDGVWIMPEGRSDLAITSRAQAIAEETLKRGYNMTTRLHVLLWGDKRGK